MCTQQDQAWRKFVDRLRREPMPFEDHLAAFKRIFEGRRPEDGPPVAWAPDDATVRRSNLQSGMAAVGIGRYDDFHAWSVRDPAAFWTHTLKRLGIVFTRPPDDILDLTGGVRDPRWLPGAELNIVDSCFTTDPDRPAAITPGPDGRSLCTTTYGELERLVNRAAKGLRERDLAPGQAIALYMPLNLECVTAYLAIIRAGSRVVSIADSFPAAEVRRRMAIAGARCIVTMDRYVRAGKTIPLYDTVVEAGASTVIVVPSAGDASMDDVPSPGADPAASASNAPRLRPGDIVWPDLLSGDDAFESVTGDPYRTTNILFSSGTTGEPKAIAWNHLTPVKSAMDGYYHQDIHGDDVTAWPTNIGWMMGPWLIYATLVNGACMALYPGATNPPDYPRFIGRAGVTMLGVIPSLVRGWRHSGATDGADWPFIRVFSSTGEPASRNDYLWLMSRAGYRAPVIEYLGGTEIGGGHLACTVLQPCSPAAFTTANLGVDFVILDETGAEVREGETGELFLVPPALGMSQRLLNGDHDEVYYEGCPAGPEGKVLRRHGDNIQRLHRGCYRAQGRADDGMNLGGIKVGPLELERVVDGHPAVYESAAVAVQPEGEGAERLVVHIVLEGGYGAADPDSLKTELQALVSSRLNPLFKIYRVVMVDELPHTASGKLVRRTLRDRMRPGS
ncbi:MAG: AMP-binding protein [Gemmatimonadetes bacterium]|nr:AMP-binding protein [Gemmatimonadota bacterium]